MGLTVEASIGSHAQMESRTRNRGPGSQCNQGGVDLGEHGRAEDEGWREDARLPVTRGPLEAQGSGSRAAPPDVHPTAEGRNFDGPGRKRPSRRTWKRGTQRHVFFGSQRPSTPGVQINRTSEVVANRPQRNRGEKWRLDATAASMVTAAREALGMWRKNLVASSVMGDCRFGRTVLALIRAGKRLRAGAGVFFSKTAR